jgi:hypothetical protein
MSGLTPGVAHLILIFLYFSRVAGAASPAGQRTAQGWPCQDSSDHGPQGHRAALAAVLRAVTEGTRRRAGGPCRRGVLCRGGTLRRRCVGAGTPREGGGTSEAVKSGLSPRGQGEAGTGWHKCAGPRSHGLHHADGMGEVLEYYPQLLGTRPTASVRVMFYSSTP